MVRDNHLRLAAPLDESRQFPCDIDVVEHADAFATDEPIVKKVQRPASICLRFDEEQCTRTDGTLSGLSFADRRLFLAIQPIDAVDDPGRFSVPLK